MKRFKLTFVFLLCLVGVFFTQTPAFAASSDGSDQAKPTDTTDETILVAKDYKTKNGIETITLAYNFKSKKIAVTFVQVSGEGENKKVSQQVFASPECPMKGKITLFLVFSNNTEAKDLRGSIEIDVQILETRHVRYSLSTVPSNVAALQVTQVEDLLESYSDNDPGARYGVCRQVCWDHFNYSSCFSCCFVFRCP